MIIKKFDSCQSRTKTLKVIFRRSICCFCKKIINEGGVVYGSALIRNSNNIDVKHIRIDKNEDICLLQGSKYVQSRIEQNFKLVKKIYWKAEKYCFRVLLVKLLVLMGFC